MRRPRAYTTIMTIMDRLARKGVVERRKVSRAYVYRPNLSAEQARDNFAAANTALSAETAEAIRSLWEREIKAQPLPW